jgi:hypothetical protein
MLLHQARQQASGMMTANRGIIEPATHNTGLLGRSRPLQPPPFAMTRGGFGPYTAFLARHPLSPSFEQLQPSEEALRHGVPMDPITGGGFVPYAALSRHLLLPSLEQLQPSEALLYGVPRDPMTGGGFVPFAASFSRHPLLPSFEQLQPSDAQLHGGPTHPTQHIGHGSVLNSDQLMQANLHANLLGLLLAAPDQEQDDLIPQHFMSNFAARMSQQQRMGQGPTINDYLLSSSASLPRLLVGGFIPPVYGPFSPNPANAGVGPVLSSSLLGNPLLLSQVGWGAEGAPPSRMDAEGGSTDQIGTQGALPGQTGAPGGREEEPTPLGRMLYLDRDFTSLSPYQCVVRKQIELFAAQRVHVESNAQGRRKPIVLGQVGIRCRHCAMRPMERSRGSTYFPSTLDGLYQAAQNMAAFHLASLCTHVPPQVRNEIVSLRENRSSSGHGKQYWADGLKALGVIEDKERGILLFASS